MVNKNCQWQPANISYSHKNRSPAKLPTLQANVFVKWVFLINLSAIHYAHVATIHNRNILEDSLQNSQSQWRQNKETYCMSCLELVSLSSARSSVRSFNEALSQARPRPMSVLTLRNIAYRCTSCTFNDSLTKLQNAAVPPNHSRSIYTAMCHVPVLA